MKSGNPALSSSTFDGLPASDNPMTLAGTINKTAMLLALVVAGAGYVWNLYFVSPSTANVGIYVIVGAVGGLVIALVTTFNKPLAPYLSPAYAILEGLAVGGISALYEARQPGIAIQAVGLTFGVLGAMLAAYRFGLIRVTERFKAGVVGATGGIALLYIVDLVLAWLGHPIAMIHEGGTLGIVFSLFVVTIAALNLVMDFDFIANGVAQRSPKYMEWYSAFGLVVTLVWLYLEIIRLLGKRR
ncbi:MAG: Bax inhibitor-1/YccA family protein [Proteobacteria bacterium]|nr:Bax inhibitor-1/YccA family protein [Pseudomonadota bacterium]